MDLQTQSQDNCLDTHTLFILNITAYTVTSIAFYTLKFAVTYLAVKYNFYNGW